MIAVIIIPPRIMRPAIRIPTMITDRRMRGLSYALALAMMTCTAHATTAAPYTATGIDLQRALRWTHRCHPPLADAPMRSKRVTEDSTFRDALFTALLVKTEPLRR